MRRGVRLGLSSGDPSNESRPTGDSEYGESTRAPAVGVSASPVLKRNIFFAGLQVTTHDGVMYAILCTCVAAESQHTLRSPL